MMPITQKAKGDGITQTVNLGTMKSLLARILPNLTLLIAEESEVKSDTTPYDIQEKISYNNIVSHQDFLRDYGQYGYEIKSLCNVCDDQDPGYTSRVYNYFTVIYKREVEELCRINKSKSRLDIIKDNSDLILHNIIDKVNNTLIERASLEISLEELEPCIVAIVCQAFVECKILEKPPSVN